MKLAITGKGGAGKTTFTVFLSLVLSAAKKNVTVIDGDSTMNLQVAFGLPPEIIKNITPLSKMDKLIEERTGAKPGILGSFFKMNPRVDDLPEKIAVQINTDSSEQAIRLIVMGTIAEAGGGCACAENVLLRNFLSHLFFTADDILILDMEAGIEHLGRGTAENVDTMLVLTEPDSCSIDVSRKILDMSMELGIKNLKIVGNKIAGEEDRTYLQDHFDSEDIIGMIPFEPGLRRRSIVKSSANTIPASVKDEIENIAKNLQNCKLL